MAVDLKSSPYYDRYSADKHYTRVLPIPGRVAQASEITEAQDIQADQLGRLGNAIFPDGTILSGCTLLIDKEGKHATISSGKIILGGIVHLVDEQTIDIAAVGNEDIGVKLVQEIVDEDDDPELCDPSQDYENYGQPGAHRLKEVVTLTVNDQDATVITKITEGDLVTDNVNSDNDESQQALTDTLARRTFDENGSYKVRGLKLLDLGVHDDANVQATVTDGKAYVRGYEIVKRAVTQLSFPKATDTRTEKNESHRFLKGATYKLGYQPVKTLDRRMCLIQKTKTMTRGGVGGGTDYIEDEEEGSVDSIVKVTDDSGSTTYTAETDYKLNNEGVDWSPGGQEPETGRTYKVTYNFNQVMKPEYITLTHNNIHTEKITKELTRGGDANGKDEITLDEGYTSVVSIDKVSKTDGGEETYTVTTDYKLTYDAEKWYVDWSPADTGKEPTSSQKYNVEMTVLHKEEDNENWYAEFQGEAPDPIHDSKMYFDYTFYLARIDLVTIDSDGEFHIYHGRSDLMRSAVSPINTNEDELPIGSVILYPNSDKIEVISYDTTRLDQRNLYNLRQRVDNLEYNVAMDDLDREAAEGENATNLRGIFTDGFIGLTKSDFTHHDFNCSFDFDNGYLMLPQNETITGMEPLFDESQNLEEVGGIYSATYDEQLAIDQKYATEDFLINPYAVYENLALLELTPYVDNWVDSEKLTVNGGTTDEYEHYEVNGGTRTQRVTQGGFFADYTRSSTEYTTDTRVETSTRTQSDVILDEAIYYMRQIEIHVKGSNYLMNSDNLVCTFAGQKVNLTPEGSSEAGSTEGSIKADKDGKFEAKFTIPEGVPCGSVEVKVESEYDHGGAIFSAQGRRQVIQETVFTVRTHITTTTKYTMVTTYHDPLAQAFYVDEDCVLTKLVLYFSEKDESKNIVIQVRNMVNGYPGPDVLDQVFVEASAIQTSDRAETGTEIAFSQPVYLEGKNSYCFTILSDSNKYKAWIGVLGGNDVLLEEAVVQQPYMQGVLFSSSNNATWTAHQDSDLKFQLYTAKYKPVDDHTQEDQKTVVKFKDAQISGATGLILAAQAADFRNAGINWEFKPNEDSEWLPITPFVFTELDQETQLVKLQCTLNSSENLSSFINKDSVNIISYYDETEGTYISRTVVMDEPFNTIVVSFEASLPNGTSYNIYYSLDNELWTELTSPKITQMDQEWYRYEFTKDGLPAYTKSYKVKIKLASTDKTVSPRIRRLKSILKNV